MTDSSSLHTHTAPSVGGLALRAASTEELANQQGDEIEDYTIKCICGYEEDDGNTVYCDNCDTWQHTECYYVDEHGAIPSNDELKKYDHFCGDCNPRPLDTRAAIERQRGRRNELNLEDRRVKKVASKSHKKKVRIPEPNGWLTNGSAQGADSDRLHDRTSRSPRDPHPPAKKCKNNHRFSHSMQFPPNATSHPHKRSGSTVLSPSKPHSKFPSNERVKEPYSAEFLHLYDNDPGDASMQTNLLNDIDITRDLGNWSSDVDELKKATNGLLPGDVFNRCEQTIAEMSLPELRQETKRDEKSLVHGRRPTWKYLTIDSFRPKDSVVAELKGKVGHMQRYIRDPANRWDYLRHPAPFVFFHPKLPIYIDTRSEGTICRYLRRSCDPNMSMKTFLENGSEYHFCFVAKQDLDAGSELTIGWVLDEHIRNYFSTRNHEDIKLEGDLDEDYVADWVGKVLAEFGGCACTSPDRCALARYDRRPTKGRNGFCGKQSPSDTSYATNSRAASEQNERRSSSGSKSESRDMTPTHNSSCDLAFGAGLEISDREKRKIAALEKNFEQLENDRHQPAQKKKKRNSGGSSVNTPATTSKQLGHFVTSYSQPNTPGLPFKPQYTDASTPRRKSGSPRSNSFNPVGKPRSTTVSDLKKRSSQSNTPMVPSPLIRQNYVDSSTQTEPDEEDAWYKPPTGPAISKKPYISFTKRLLLRSQNDRAKLEERRRVFLGTFNDARTNGHVGRESGDPQYPRHDLDIEMEDAGLAPVPITASASEAVSTHVTCPPNRTANTEIKPPPPPWPAIDQFRPMNGYRSSDLRVQLPPKPSLPSEPSSNTPLVETPTIAVPQSLFTHNATPHSSSSHSLSGLVQPSPIKKKVSLGEYFSRLKGSQPSTDMPASSSPTMQQGAFKPSVVLSGDSKGAETVVETPRREELDPMVAEQLTDPKN